MSQTARLSIKIDADGKAAATALNKVKKSINGIDAEAKTASVGVASLAKSMLGLAAGYVAIDSLVGSFTDVNVQAGKLRASLQTVTGSVGQATAAWEKLEEFASKTPYALDQSVRAFIKLKALGLDPSIEALTSYGNTASALGKDLNDMIEAVADASVGEFERLKEFGIKAKSEGDSVALTFQGVTTTIGKNADEITTYLKNIGDVNFAGAMAREMDTLGGAISNLGDEYDAVFRAIGDAGATEALSDGIRYATSAIADLTDWISDDLEGALDDVALATSHWTGLLEGSGTIIDFLIDELSQLHTTMYLVREALDQTGGATNLFEELADDARFFGDAILELPDNISSFVTISVGLIDQMLTAIAANWSAMLVDAQRVWNSIASAASASFGNMRIIAADAIAYISGLLASLTGNLATAATAVNQFSGVGAGVAASLSTITAAYTDMTKAGGDARASAAEQADQYRKTGAALKEERAEIIKTKDAAIKASDDIIAATLDETAAKQAAIEAQREFNSEFEAVVGIFEEVDRTVVTSTATTVKATTASTGLGAALGGGGGGGGGGGPSVADGAKAAKRELDKLTSSVDSLIDKYLPVIAATEDFAEAQATLKAAVDAGLLSQAQATEILGKMQTELDETTREASKAASTFSDVWDDAAKGLDSTFDSMWRNLIDGTDGTLDDMEDLLKSWLAKVANALITEPLTVALTASLSGTDSTTSTATSSTSSLTSSSSTLSSLKSLFSGNSIGTTAASGLDYISTEILGNSLGTGTLFEAGTGLAGTSNLAFGVGGLAGSLIGSSLFDGEYSDLGSSLGATGGTLVGSAVSSVTAGTTLGAAAGPIGAVIGGILGGIAGGALGDLFGSDKEPSASFRYSTVGDSSYFEDGLSTTGGLGLNFGLGADSYDASFDDYADVFAANSDLSYAIQNLLGKSTSADVEEGISKSQPFATYDALGDPDAAFQSMWESLISHVGDYGGAIGDLIEETVGDVPTEMADAAEHIADALTEVAEIVDYVTSLAGTAMGEFLGLTGDLEEDIEIYSKKAAEFAEEGMTVAEAFDAMIANVLALGTATAFTNAAEEFADSNAWADAAEKLADWGGGYDTLVAGMTTYYDEFFSEEEKRADLIATATDLIEESLADLGYVVPETRAELVSLVQALDLTTDAGLEGFGVLMQLAESFDYVFDAAEELAEADEELAEAYEDQKAALVELLEAATESDNLTLVSAELAAMGYAGGIATDALLDWVAGLDTATESGREMLDALDAMEGDFQAAIAYMQLLEETAENLTPTLEELAVTITAMVDALAPQTAQENLDEITAQLEEIGYTGAVTGEALAAFLSALDTTTTAGYETAAAIVNLGQGLVDATTQTEAILTTIATFIESIKPDAVATAEAFDAIGLVFEALKTEIPDSSDALYDLVAAGAFSSEQLLLLAAHSAELALVWEYYDEQLQEVEDSAQDAADAQQDLIDGYQLQISVYTELANELERTISAIDASLAALKTLNQTAEVTRQQALATVKAGEIGDDLDRAISTLGNVDPNDYATREDYESSIDENAQALSTLRGALDAQVTESESMVVLLEARISLAEEEIALAEEANTLAADTVTAVNSSAETIAAALGIAVEQAEARAAAAAAAAAGDVGSFAAGGYHPGGLRVVGESGPELEFTSPSHIYSTSNTRRVLGFDDLIDSINMLSRQVGAGNRAMVKYSEKSAKVLAKWDVDGQPEERT